MTIRQFIRVKRSDGGNPVNLTGSLTFDDGLIIPGYATAAGVLSFNIPIERRLNGVEVATTCDGATAATVKRGETNDQDGQSILWDEDVIIQTDVNPFDVPLDVIRNVRGSIWTRRAPIPWGPRPNDPDNICAMDYYADEGVYADADLDVMEAAYFDQAHYRHFPSGPDVAQGYHGQYPDVDFRANPLHVAQRLQRAWNKGGIPIQFLCPDGWSLADCQRELEPIYRRPEFQRVTRLVVPHGWEPGGYNISNAEWCAFFAWARSVFPNARLGLHMIADFDAPVGGDDEHLVPPGMDTKEWAWRNVAAAGCSFFLIQWGGYLNSGPDLQPGFVDEAKKNLQWFLDHFAAWGLDIDVIAGEYAAFNDYWQGSARGWTEDKAKAVGDLALSVPGVRGFFDGGTCE